LDKLFQNYLLPQDSQSNCRANGGGEPQKHLDESISYQRTGIIDRIVSSAEIVLVDFGGNGAEIEPEDDGEDQSDNLQGEGEVSLLLLQMIFDFLLAN
jgi:hypothetical protein